MSLAEWPTIAAVTVLALVLAVVAGYNLLVRRRNAVAFATGTLDAMLQLRYDLIPKLTEVARASAAHERETLERCAAARRVTSADTAGRLADAAELGRSIARVIAVAEAQPQLRASEQFQHLMRTLNEVEERISAARRTYNALVMAYNNAIQSVPLNLVAGAFGHRVREYFEADRDSRIAPQPRFGP
jgi:LemA protein